MLTEFLAHYGVALDGYCLMPNHVHLVVTPHNENSLSAALRRLHSEYARPLRQEIGPEIGATRNREIGGNRCQSVEIGAKDLKSRFLWRRCELLANMGTGRIW